MNNGRYYGNSSNGYGYSPNNNTVNNPTFGGNTSMMYAQGSRQGGYYYSATTAKQSKGEWVQSGGGAWYRA